MMRHRMATFDRNGRWAVACVATLGLVFTVPSVEAKTAHASQVTLKLTETKSTSPASADQPVVPPRYGVTPVVLPLYPSATSSSQTFSMAFEQTPVSWYVRTAKADYTIPAAPSVVERWYVQRMKDEGYRQTGSATVGNEKTGERSQGIVFQPIRQVHGHDIEVDISFEGLGHARTLMEYWATDLVIPARPASSFMPGDVIEITGTMTVYGSKVTQRKVDITDAGEIQTLVTTSNAIHQLVPGVNPGGPMIWGTAELTFHTSQGRSISMHVNNDSLSVNGVGLQDDNGTVWKALEKIVSA